MKVFYLSFGMLFALLAFVYFFCFQSSTPGKSVDSLKNGDQGEYEIHIMILPDSVVKDTCYPVFDLDGQMAIHTNETYRFSGNEYENSLGKQLITWELANDTAKKLEGFLYRNGKVIQITKKIR